MVWTRFKARNTLYTFIMGWPQKTAVVQALGTSSPHSPGKILNVEMLGYQGRLTWTQGAVGIRVELPAESPWDYAVTLKVILA